MSYEPKTWECGETITADALNHIEQGIADSGGGTTLIVEEVSSRDATAEECVNGGVVATFNHTWQEVKDAYDQGKTVYMQLQQDKWYRYALSAIAVDETAEYPYSIQFGEVRVIANTQTDPLIGLYCTIL